MNGRMINPKIRVPAAVWEKFMAYIHACPQEVSGLGTVEKRAGGLVITDFFLLGQVVSPATTDIDPTALSRFVANWVSEGKDLGALRLWWHSHAAMSVFWSATDDVTIRELTENGWLLSIVGNHRGETKTRLTVCSGGIELSADDLQPEIFTDVSEDALAAARTEVAAKVQTTGFLGRRRSVLSPSVFSLGIGEAINADGGAGEEGVSNPFGLGANGGRP